MFQHDPKTPPGPCKHVKDPRWTLRERDPTADKGYFTLRHRVAAKFKGSFTQQRPEYKTIRAQPMTHLAGSNVAILSNRLLLPRCRIIDEEGMSVFGTLGRKLKTPDIEKTKLVVGNSDANPAIVDEQ
ncbi:predicted protein [Coccidioides posadasii str. Silveira]|uniref:Predicted protein n=2 Tax=Coccidioides posadasii TaxID=199306 RepID=E9D5V6_COCPS|nr:predicted protein [Coccidioides posadasii str. Silveira]